jgi:hypothetical protein
VKLLKVEDLVKIYGLPIVCKNIDELKKEIEKTKEKSLTTPIQWWLLKFQNGEVYYYNSSKRDWEVLEI